MPKYSKPRKTWQYSKEFKVKAVMLSLIEGIQVKEVAETFDIHFFMLSRWRKEYQEGKIVADKRKKLAGVVSRAEKEFFRVKRLEAENRKLKQELDLLKKWQRFLSEEHQQDIDSSRGSDQNLESKELVSGWEYRAVAIMIG
jgi:transposase